MTSIQARPEPDHTPRTGEPASSTAAAWTDQVRRNATHLIANAARCRREADQALAYFLRTGTAHGLTPAELADASGLNADEIHALTDPAVAE
jgi:hypothetical protein